MRRRLALWVKVLVPLVIVTTFLAVASCSSSKSSPVGLAQGCAINSDCNAPLVCAFGLCHEACAASRDCPPGERCVTSSSNDRVCELPAESTCKGGATCPSGLLCSTSDQQCRTPCSTDKECATGQTCNQSACYDPAELVDASSDAGTDAPVIDAPIDSPVDAGPLGYIPSNFDLNAPAIVDAGDGGGIDLASAPVVTISTAACDTTCLPTPVTISMVDTSLADLYLLKSLTVESSTVLTLRGPRPIILAVLGAVDIQGAINVNGDGLTYTGIAGPGGYSYSGTVQGPGGGGNGGSALYPSSSAGGGSYCGAGGKGSAVTGALAPGGSTYGTAEIIPLMPGSAGGGGFYYFGPSGGAFQISAGASILIRSVGFINAGGGAGTYSAGGAGGAILLEAPTITIQGNVAANGGSGGTFGAGYPGANGAANDQPVAGGASGGGAMGGAGSAGATINGSDGIADDAGSLKGSGGGGAGRVRLNSTAGAATVTGIVSPSLTTPCATQGTLKL